MTDSSEYLSPNILDSRRLTGANVFGADIGAVMDVAVGAVTDDRVESWRRHVFALAQSLGWPPCRMVVRVTDSSAQFFITAPIDGVTTATALNELAWARCEDPNEAHDAEETSLRDAWALERTQFVALAPLIRAARSHAVNYCFDDESATVGSGAGSRTWPLDSVPDALDFDAVYDVPTVLVTGSNGKTTTTRLIAAMWRTAGVPVGWSCSDGVYVDTLESLHVLEEGDLTGPAGARMVLRDARVHAAVLETARGGLLRRGLATARAHVAVITNISADHFGEYGVESLSDLAAAKAIVVHALVPTAGVLVLNAQDEHLLRLTVDSPVRVVWFAVIDDVDVDGARSASSLARVHAAVAQYGLGAIVQHGALRIAVDGVWHECGRVHAFPLTRGGTAVHNIANVAAAALAAVAAGVPLVRLQETLARFGASEGDNPGRLMVRALGDITIVLDYAHNPDGLAALGATAESMPATRRLLLIGQAGNRDDAQLRDLGAAAWHAARFDRVIIKRLPELLRGRNADDVPARIREGLLQAGAPAAALDEVASELEGVRAALEWAGAGDVLVLGIHTDRARVLRLLDALETLGWRSGTPLPAGDPDHRSESPA